MRDLGDEIRKLRKTLRLSQELFRKPIGVSNATLSDWENGKQKPNGENLLSLISHYPQLIAFVPKGEIFSRDIREPSAEYLGHVDAWDSKTELDEDETEVPFFMDVELAAGIGGELAQENNGFKLRFSKSTLRKCGVEPANAACVKVSGNSMEPRLFDGDVVGVDTGNKRIVDGKTYAINHDGLLRIKRLYRIPGGGIRINSLNTDEHPDERYDAEERDVISIIGRVFWHSSIW